MLFSFFRTPPLHSARGVAAIYSTLPWCEPKRNKGILFSSQVHSSLWIVGAGISFSAEKHLYLITLLLKECHSQREFQCLRAQGEDCFGCSELSVGSLHVRVLCFSFPFVGSLPSYWCLPADLPGSSVIVEWISAIFQRVWNLTEYFSV